MAETLDNRIAIIDLGTNTFNLLISEKGLSGYNTIFKTKIPVNLGKGGIQKNIISEDAIERGLKALITHKNTIKAYKAESIHAFATSAIRSARNGNEFTKKAFDLTGINIKIISGSYEAELIYKGVLQALPLFKESSLIMDIGGGSTEFIVANNNGIQWKHSFDIGVSRLLASNSFTDPITKEEVVQLKKYLKKELTPLFNTCEQFPVCELIGSSGSFESISEILDGIENRDRLNKKNNEVLFNTKKLNEILEKIINSTKEERQTLNGLVSFRVNTIVLASIIIQYILETLDIKNVRLSRYALREGVLGLIFDNM